MKKIMIFVVAFMTGFLRILFGLALVLSLSGCWHVPVSALWRLRKVDPLTLDPAQIRIAARAPDWLDAPSGHVHFQAVFHKGESDEATRVLDLMRADSPADLRALAGERVKGFHFAVFRAAPADIGWLVEHQVRARVARASGEHHQGSFKLWADPCRRAEPPEGPVRVDLYLSLGEKEEFFKVYDDVDLREPGVFTGKTFDEAVPACGKIASRVD